MSERTTRTRKTRARIAPFAVGLVVALAGVAYAVAQTVGGPDSKQDDHGVAAQTAGGFSIQIGTLTRSVAPGDEASFPIRIRGANRRLVRLSVRSGLPAGASAWFSPPATRKPRSTLTIDTGSARSGGHRLRLLAVVGRRRKATAAVNVVITVAEEDPSDPGNPTNFSISGDLPGLLIPGSSEPLDLALTNPDSGPISITQLMVSIDGINAPLADATHPCTLDDFAVAQFSGAYGFTVGPGATSTLSQLGFPEAQWPQVTMLDRPVNQDGCKGASLSFSYTGTSTGGAP